MRLRSRRTQLAWLATVTAMAGCATVQPIPQSGECAEAEVLSARGSSRPIAGMPGFATQRFLADVLPAADTATNSAEGEGSAMWAAWLARSRAVALHDGSPQAGQPVADGCVAAAVVALKPALAQQLVQQAAVGSDYSLLQRTLGAYPLTGLGLRLGVSGYQQETLQSWAEFALPAAGDGEYAAFALAEVAPELPPRTAAALREAPRDALGVPVVSAELATALARHFAPRFQIETQGDFDIPGKPVIDAGLPTVDHTQPRLSWRLDYTRVHGVVLPQISWVIWFSERAAERRLDFYSGPLDGVVWRATFGPDGWPVAYDSIHPCGCYHLVFPARHAALDPGAGFWEEARLQPQAPLRWSQVTLVLASGNHYVQAVLPGDAPGAEPSPLTLEPWVETRAALAPAMGPQGVIAGTERLERYWLWPSGVRSPGAMRDWGRQATAFIGQQHFDDPQVLEPYIAAGVVRLPVSR